MFRPAPIRIGLLFDFPQADGGEDFEATLRLGVEEAGGGRVDRDLEFLRAEATGLPAGTEHAASAGSATSRRPAASRSSGRRSATTG